MHMIVAAAHELRLILLMLPHTVIFSSFNLSIFIHACARAQLSYYVNKHWTPEAGGQLRLFHADGTNSNDGANDGDVVDDIEPLCDRAVVFWSDKRVPHMVLPAHSERFAVSVWFSDANERSASAADAAAAKSLPVGVVPSGDGVTRNHDQHVSLAAATSVLSQKLFTGGVAALPKLLPSGPVDLLAGGLAGLPPGSAWWRREPGDDGIASFTDRINAVLIPLSKTHEYWRECIVHRTSIHVTKGAAAKAGQSAKVTIPKLLDAALGFHMLVAGGASTAAVHPAHRPGRERPPAIKAGVELSSGDLLVIYHERLNRAVVEVEAGPGAELAVLSMWFYHAQYDKAKVPGYESKYCPDEIT